MEILRPQIQSIVNGLVEGMLNHAPPLDFVQYFALPLPSKIICTILGVPYEAHGFFQDRADIMISSTSTLEESARAARELIDEYLGDLIDRKLAEPADDLLSRLAVNHLRTGEICRYEALSTARLLLMAGHDTTSNTIALSLVTLLNHPEQLQALKDDLSLVNSAVEELFRFLDPTHGGRRRVALADVEINGQTIRAGEAIIALNPSANRDETMFEDPDRFDIRRRPKSHMAFGGGIHKCLGQSLAREELRIVLNTLFSRVPGIRLAIPFEEIEFNEDRVVYGISRLPVAW
jgi:cytochrome P450